MRCKICDSLIARPVWNAQLKDWEVCGVCLDVINHVFEDPVTQDPYAEVDEEELSQPPEEILLDNTV